MNELINIENRIYTVRGQRVMLDSDLARLYEVETRVLIQSVKRNIDRFPNDFAFQLDKSEFSDLKSQIVTSSWGGTRKLPYAFTEQGVAMLSGILKSMKAIQVNIQIMRTFIQLRNYALSNVALNDQITELRQLLTLHIENTDNKFSEHEESIAQIVKALNNLVQQPHEPKKIGFGAD